MTTGTFKDILHTMDAYMGLQGRNVLLFVWNCTSHMQDTIFLRNVRVVIYPLKCRTMLQFLDWNIIKCFKQFYRKHLLPMQNLYTSCLIDSVKNANQKSIFCKHTVHSSGLVTSHTGDSSNELLSMSYWCHLYTELTLTQTQVLKGTGYD
jgi:hypothetical protein